MRNVDLNNNDVDFSESLLFPGNSKTGAPIALFDLPRVLTCPGATDVCQKSCYVQSSRRFPGVDKPLHERNYVSRRPGFIKRMVADIIRSKMKVVMIHGSGDFYNAHYVAKWVDIIQKTPDVVYYAYTRSWRCPEQMQQLYRLRRLPNMQLWWLSDRETGSPSRGLVAYLSTDDEDAPDFDASLIFRVKHDTEKLEIGGVSVCPLENGRPEIEAGGMTCAKCRICFSRAKTGS